MTTHLDRRRFLKASAAGALVTGLSLQHRRWVAHAAPGPDVVPIPDLDGSLELDPELCARAGDDFGHMVSDVPWAVLFPGSIDDIETMVRFARQHRLHIAGRQAFDESHSTYGQSQVEAGIVIDMASLSHVPAVGPDDDEIWVEAGARWREVTGKAFAAGKSPPVFPDYVDLSVGGTLSVGGIGGQTHLVGLTVDNVTGLEVVTGNGSRVTCSRSQNAFLFWSVLGGLGQFAIIARARLRLRPVPPMARMYAAYYDDIHTFMADQERVVAEERFDFVQGGAEVAAEGAGWIYRLDAVKYFAPGSEPDDDALLAGLSFDPGSVSATDTDYLAFVYRLDPLVALLRELGHWDMPHPWLNLFLPASQAPALVQSMLDRTTPADMGSGPILIYPFRASAIGAHYPVLPHGEVCYLLAMLRTAVPGTPEQVEAMLDANRAFFEDAREHGGTFYPINALPLTPGDWRRQFGRRPLGWTIFKLAKRLFDHRRVLTPGQRIFP